MRFFPRFWFLIFLAAACIIIYSFRHSHSNNHFVNGSIRGYVLPKFIKPGVKIVMPKPNKPQDSVHQNVKVDTAGYFEINNLSPATYQLIFFARDKRFKKRIEFVSVASGAATDLGRVFLDRIQ